MGKQSRRSRKHKQKQSNTNNHTNDNSSSNNNTPGIIGKIQHNDAKIRDATLSALAVTLFQTNNTTCTTKLIDKSIVTAVLQRIALDTDVNSACAASGCILNYLGNKANLAQTKQLMEQCDAVTLLLHRLNHPDTNNHTNANSNNAQLVSLILDIMCILIEQGSEELVHQYFLKDNNCCWNVLFPLLISANDENCRVGAARALHALLDGTTHAAIINVNDVNGIMDRCQMIQNQIIKNGNCHSKARLHACGIVMLLLRSLQHSKDTCMYIDIIKDILSVLAQYMDYNIDIASALAHRVHCTMEIMALEEEDEVMEKNVAEDIKRKGESAKDIARRQKDQKQQKQQVDTTDMEDEPESLEAETSSSLAHNNDDDSKPKYGKDVLYDYEKALSSWQAAVQPLKLALEVCTNVFCNDEAEGNGGDNNTLEDWASDDEDKMELVAATTTTQSNSLSSSSSHSQSTLLFLNSLTVEKAIECGMLDRVMLVFESLLKPLKISNDIPIEVTTDLMDLRGKCAACIANIVLNNVNNNVEVALIKIWRTLVCSLDVVDGFYEASDDVSCAMLAMIQSSEVVTKSIHKTDLELILRVLSSNKTPQTRQNAATMLGYLCAAPHSREVDELVCKQLVLSLQNDASIMVANEVLCAIMDVYGNDDAHNDVFTAHHVLTILQKHLGVFKRQISDYNGADTDLFLLKETALNTKRFIKYMQQHS